MSLLVVMAHFDVDRILRKHVIKSLETYMVSADRLIVVSTSGLDEGEVERLPSGVEFITRRNYGYDFFSYKWGLDFVGNYQDYDRVLVVNDSFIGPVVPLENILESTSVQNSDFAGLTLSNRHGRHVQSFFFTFTSTVSKSNGMRNFWRDLIPISDRFKVISNYEIGLSRSVAESGFKIDAYFNPSDTEVELAQNRWVWHLKNRLSHAVPDKTIFDLSPHKANALDWNPAVAFADQILNSGRMPVLKFDTLRYDPYALGASKLLKLCDAVYPEHVVGVQEFLDQTADRYPFRTGEINLTVSEQRLIDSGLGYKLQTLDIEHSSDNPSSTRSF